MTTDVHHTVLEMKLPAVLDTEYLFKLTYDGVLRVKMGALSITVFLIIS